jgi:hypothetical protein
MEIPLRDWDRTVLVDGSRNQPSTDRARQQQPRYGICRCGYSSSPILTQEGFSQSTAFPVPSTLLLPTANLSNPFPNGFQDPVGSYAGLTTFLGQNVDFFSPEMKNPYSEPWTLEIQQQITPTLLMEVAYIGNHALRLPMSVAQLNGIPRKYLSTLPNRDTALITTLTASVPNPFAGLIPALGNSGLNGTNTSVRQLLTPFPQFPVADSTSFSSGVTMRNGVLGSWCDPMPLTLEEHPMNSEFGILV